MASFEDKMKQAQLAIAALEKEFGEGVLMKGDSEPAKIEVVPTGNLAVDLALGVGGLPKGRIVEIFGSESVGKTLLALRVVAQCQAQGGLVAYIDAEHALDSEWCIKNGVSWDDMYISQPDYGEQALKVVKTLVNSGSFDVIIVDSVAALTPKTELDGEIGDAHVGLQSRMMSQAMRILAGNVNNTNTLVIFINQLRDKIGPMANGGSTTPGGRALKFYSSVRIELKKIKTLTKSSESEPIGSQIRANIVKNKVAPPFRYAEYALLHGKGIDDVGTIIDLAVKYGYMKLKGAYFYPIDDNGEIAEKSLGQGKDNAVKNLSQDKEMMLDLKNKISKRYKESQIFYEPEQKEEPPADDN